SVCDRAVSVPAPQTSGEDPGRGRGPDRQQLLEVLLNELLYVGQLHNTLTRKALEDALDKTADDHRLAGTCWHGNDRVPFPTFFEVAENGFDCVVLVISELHSIASP